MKFLQCFTRIIEPEPGRNLLITNLQFQSIKTGVDSLYHLVVTIQIQEEIRIRVRVNGSSRMRKILNTSYYDFFVTT